MSVPAGRSLEAVLADALSQPAGLRLLVGTFAAPPADTRYANVTIGGAVVKIPRLKGAVVGAAGTVAYVLADGTRMIVLGTVGT